MEGSQSARPTVGSIDKYFSVAEKRRTIARTGRESG
jgi:hypothetical protein